jgi:hypothetical protein
MLQYLNAKEGTENIFKQKLRTNECLDEICDDNGVKAENAAAPKYLIVRSAMFRNHNIYRFTCTSPNGKTHSQIGHILVDSRRHSECT